MLWVISASVLGIWLVLWIVFRQNGYVHIFLLLGISLLVIQIIAYRKTRFHATSSHSKG